MRWWEVIKKNIGHITLTGMAADGWRRQVLADMRTAEANKKAEELEKSKAMEENSLANRTRDILKEDQEVKLTGYTIDARDSFNAYIKAKNSEDIIKDKIDKNNFSPGETKEILTNDLKRHKQETEQLREISEAKSDVLFKYALEVKKSDSFDWLSSLIDNYQHYLNSLLLDQKVALVNVIGYIALLNTSISILLILGGNHIIQLLNLDGKFPWLSKILRARAKVITIYLRIYIIIYFLVLFGYLGLNIYMLVWRG